LVRLSVFPKYFTNLYGIGLRMKIRNNVAFHLYVKLQYNN
jgi:hypothetical protein